MMLDLLERGVVALERIATALERFEPEEAPVCRHPVDEREVMPDSTMAALSYRCKACGAEGIN